MSGEVTVSTLVTIAGAALAAYMAVRVGLASLQATVTTALAELNRRLDRMESSRDTHAEDISELKATVREHGARIVSLEHRPTTGSFRALDADNTGPHKAQR